MSSVWLRGVFYRTPLSVRLREYLLRAPNYHVLLRTLFNVLGTGVDCYVF